MKKTIIILLILAGLVIAYWLISPLFINKRVSEDLPVPAAKEEKTVSENNGNEGGVINKEEKNAEENTKEEEKPALTEISLGSFSGLAGHNAEGEAKIIKVGEQFYLRFEENFKVTNGPDVFVYLGTEDDYSAGANLGLLKGNIGSQNYLIPDGFDLDKSDTAWVWCRAFSVPFGKAVLK